MPNGKSATRNHIARQEVERLERLVQTRKAAVVDAQSKLAAARQRLKDGS